MSKPREHHLNAMARVFGLISDHEMEIEYLRLSLARLPQFEPYQAFNFMDIKGTGTLEPNDLEDFMLIKNHYLTEREMVYLTQLHATQKYVMTWDGFLRTFLPQNDDYMK